MMLHSDFREREKRQASSLLLLPVVTHPPFSQMSCVRVFPLPPTHSYMHTHVDNRRHSETLSNQPTNLRCDFLSQPLNSFESRSGQHVKNQIKLRSDIFVTTVAVMITFIKNTFILAQLERDYS